MPSQGQETLGDHGLAEGFLDRIISPINVQQASKRDKVFAVEHQRWKVMESSSKDAGLLPVRGRIACTDECTYVCTIHIRI